LISPQEIRQSRPRILEGRHRLYISVFHPVYIQSEPFTW